MLSLEYLATVKFATILCNNPALKRDVLCAPGSDVANTLGTATKRIKVWNKMVSRKASAELKKLRLIKKLREKVVSVLLIVGRKMLNFSKYIENWIGLHRAFSVIYLDISYFTSKGIIESETVAKRFMNVENLSTKQKYKLACLYCFTDHINYFYSQMSENDKREFYDPNPENVNQPHLVMFWTYYLMGDIDKLKGSQDIDLFRLKTAIQDGNKTSVEYFLRETNAIRQENVLTYAALVTIRKRETMHNSRDVALYPQYFRFAKDMKFSADYCVDILLFLMNEMQEDELVSFLKQDIEESLSESHLGYPGRSRVLEYFLDWPYQSNFMKTVNVMWGFLSLRTYTILLLNIRAESKYGVDTLKYGEDKSFDYAELLREFWCRSPEKFKRYVFKDKMIASSEGNTVLNEGKDLLVDLFALQTFNVKDMENVDIILRSASEEEKKNIISSKEMLNICIRLMRKRKWEILHLFLYLCFSTEDQIEFKERFSFTEDVRGILLGFIINDEWIAVESFIKWSSLTENKLIQLKEEMISYVLGNDIFFHMYLNEDVEIFDKISKWCFISEDEIKYFKKELFHNFVTMNVCENLILGCNIERLNECIEWSLLSETEILDFKKEFAYERGGKMLEKLISGNDKERIYDQWGNTIGNRITFKGGNWVQVEEFLTWCFSTEEEIIKYKEHIFELDSSKIIHFKLIQSNKWYEAETYFYWLGLCSDEIKELKKETLFNFNGDSMFVDMMLSDEEFSRHIEFKDYGTKSEAIELFLRWFLPDKNAVLEFKTFFITKYIGILNGNLLLYFNSAITQILNDIVAED